jgi:hypothetical protein
MATREDISLPPALRGQRMRRWLKKDWRMLAPLMCRRPLLLLGLLSFGACGAPTTAAKEPQPVASAARRDAPMTGSPAAVASAPTTSAPAVKDCSKEYLCINRGACTDVDGVCVVGAALRGDCARLRGPNKENYCATQGLCTPLKGDCIVGSHDDCLQSSLCKQEGLCSALEGDGRSTCFAQNDEDCGRSAACRQLHNCRAHEGACVYSAKSCRSSNRCRHAGDCAKARLPPTDGFWPCEPGSDADCRQSQICADDGMCSKGHAHGFPQPRCVAASDALCRKSTGCRERGNCSRTHVRGPGLLPICGPKSKAECEQSEGCNKRGRCAFFSADEGGTPACTPAPLTR